MSDVVIRAEKLGKKFIIGHRAETHSILMRARSGTVRHIHAVHHLDRKIIPLRK